MYLCLAGRERCRLTFFKLQVTMLEVGVYLYFNLQWKNMGWKGVATWTALHMMKDKYYFPKIWIHLYVCRLCLCIHTYLWYVLGLSANVFPTVVIVLKVHMLLNFQCKDSPLPCLWWALTSFPAWEDMRPPRPHQWGTTVESSSLRPRLGSSGLSFTSHKTEGISRGTSD